MHEGNFTEKIVEVVLEETAKHKAKKIKSISISVGEMLHLEAESVKLHFERLAQGTSLEGAQLQMKEVPVKVKCSDCEHMGCVEDHHLLLCPECESHAVKLIEGDKISVDAIEFEG